MTGVIIDSPILIDALIGLGSARTAIVTAPERYITRLAWAELMGSAKGDEGRVEEFLDNFRIVELTEIEIDDQTVVVEPILETPQVPARSRGRRR